jgi:mannosylglycerate hydrolase
VTSSDKKPPHRTLHLVSHTHWDREWYLTFQQFRLRLVSLIDDLLELLDADPNYKHFTLDGQTILLDDYLYMQPEKAMAIRKHVQSGRLLIGPWYILPDEFLVSPEATIRNLLQGDRIARQFGSKMMIGYSPDPFGHIAQMPQILQGFNIDSACVQRGLADQPCEFWWQSPDGSRVLMANLRDGYMNAAHLPTSDPERFISDLRRIRDSLLPYAATSHLLLMHGNDHMQPLPDTSAAIAYANKTLESDLVLHSTPPQYFAAIHSQIKDQEISLPTVMGELRSSKRHHLLPGVLSTRMWIKQRNHACETLLEKWAEPFSTWADLLHNGYLLPQDQGEIPAPDKRKGGEIFYTPENMRLSNPSQVLRQAWRLLMECHPHDSICGCSIDQVHTEMRPRFDQVEQIGNAITQQSLESLITQINTQPPAELDKGDAVLALSVFNPVSGPRTGPTTVEFELPKEVLDFEIVDEAGEAVEYTILGSLDRHPLNAVLDRDLLRTTLSMVHNGRVAGYSIQEATLQRNGKQVDIQVVLSNSGEPDIAVWQQGLEQVRKYLADPEITTYHVTGRPPARLRLRFAAGEVPGFGYRTYWLATRPGPSPAATEPAKLSGWMRFVIPILDSLARTPFIRDRFSPSRATLEDHKEAPGPPYIISNQYFEVKASPSDGTLTLLDKRTEIFYSNLNRFADGGDSGDEYNYNPPPLNDLIDQTRVRHVRISRDEVQQTLELSLSLRVPKGLGLDRQSRHQERISVPITTCITLTSGVPRVDIRTEIDNGNPPVRDHRLRVHFPTPFNADHANHDGHFMIVRRPIGVPEFDQGWIEQPRPEVPQRAFTSVSNDSSGLAVANRGLPEVEVLLNSSGNAEIALTLLRCVGWLSRDDLSTRRGHAGPMMATPEAQMPGKYAFEYSIIPHQNNLLDAHHQASAFNAPMKSLATAIHSGSLSYSASFLQASPEDFILSSVKAAEDGKGWIIRGYNLSEKPINLSLSTLVPFEHAAKVNLAEEILEVLSPIGSQGINCAIGGYEVLTVKFW